MFTPELKVKTFLDSLAYYFLLGNTGGIETNYQSVMTAKREIPVSSCPSSIDNIFYGSTAYSGDAMQEENTVFRNMLEKLDEQASVYEVKKPQGKRVKSKLHKILRLGIKNGEWIRVDTEGKFWIGDNQYIISDQEIQYQPVSTDYGDYYAMDKILYADGKFYDMNYDEVEVHAIGGIVPCDMFGAEN